MILSNEHLISRFIEEAKNLGFIAVGFSRADRPLFFDEFCAWINKGKHGEMAWLKRNLDLRKHPERLLNGCRTVISLAYPYSRLKPCTPDGFTAARFTEPKESDYHGRLRKIARNLARSLHEMFPESRTRICVDSAPVLERSFGYASGMGFIGKNSMLIVPGYGSYFFLVEILITALLPFQEAVPMENQCNSCTKCIDACPNGALEKGFSLNASRCLSYLSIEYRNTVNSRTGRIMGNCFFGCDVCQEVCPFNEDAFSMELSLPPTDEILEMDEKGFKDKFGDTAFAHAGLEKLKSNIRAARSSTAEEISS